MKTLLTLLVTIAGNVCAAQGTTIEAAALEVARKHNDNQQVFLDEMTVSSTAQAIGKNIRFTNVLRVRQGLSQAKRNEFQIALCSEMVPKICRANADNVALEKGLYYTFLYFNTYGEKLAEFIVNARACGRG